MRIMYVHATRGYLGDAIRVNKVYSFFKNRNYKVYEKRINIEKLRAFLLALTGLKHLLLNQKKGTKTGFKSPFEVLASAFFRAIQEQILKEARVVRPHVIVAETSLVGYFSLLSKNNLNIPLVTDVHGLIGEESEIGGSKYVNVMSNVEISAFQGSDYLLTVSNSMKRQIRLEHEIQDDKMLVVPNGGDVQQYQTYFGLPLKIIYAGNFAAYEKVSDYLEIAKSLEHSSSFVFFLMGDGVQKKMILSRINKEKIPIKFMGLKTRQEALRFFSEMHVGVVTSTSGVERKVAFPIKMLDYMSCGLPVVAPKIGDWGELIEKENCGIALKENNITEFIKAFNTLCNKEKWEKKSIKAKECIEKKYNWNSVLEPLGDLITEITT